AAEQQAVDAVSVAAEGVPAVASLKVDGGGRVLAQVLHFREVVAEAVAIIRRQRVVPQVAAQRLLISRIKRQLLRLPSGESGDFQLPVIALLRAAEEGVVLSHPRVIAESVRVLKRKAR